MLQVGPHAQNPAYNVTRKVVVTNPVPPFTSNTAYDIVPGGMTPTSFALTADPPVSTTIPSTILASSMTTGENYSIVTAGTTTAAEWTSAGLSFAVGSVFEAKGSVAGGGGAATVYNPTLSSALTLSTSYMITYTGTTNWSAAGAGSNAVGTVFTATGAPSGTGVATPVGTPIAASLMSGGVYYAITTLGTTNWSSIAESASFTAATIPPVLTGGGTVSQISCPVGAPPQVTLANTFSGGEAVSFSAYNPPAADWSICGWAPPPAADVTALSNVFYVCSGATAKHFQLSDSYADATGSCVDLVSKYQYGAAVNPLSMWSLVTPTAGGTMTLNLFQQGDNEPGLNQGESLFEFTNWNGGQVSQTDYVDLPPARWGTG